MADPTSHAKTRAPAPALAPTLTPPLDPPLTPPLTPPLDPPLDPAPGPRAAPRPGRRAFLESTAALAGGLVLGFWLPPGGTRVAQAQSAPTPFAPNAFLRIAPDGTVTVMCNKSEMGQGVYTAFAMLVAEELEADWSKIRVEAAPNDAKLYGHPQFGMQFTGGSMSVTSEWDRLRQAGAAAREMLVSAAARTWGVARSACRAENGAVLGPDGKRLGYGELAAAAGRLEVPKEVALKPPSAFRVIGKPTKRVDSRDKVTGRAQFGLDVRREGMLTALVARPPAFGATVKDFRADKVEGIPGVRAVVKIPQGVAVVASSFWAAKQGRDALEVEWDTSAADLVSTAAQRARFAELAKTPGLPAKRAGDADKALAGAAKQLAAEYDVPYLAHAPMEPLNVVVALEPDGCEVWTGTQMQTGDAAAIARLTGIAPERIRIHTTLLGGGFGRRASPTADFVVEALYVAHAVSRGTNKALVRVVWTREDDIRGGYYRPQWHSRIAAGLDAAGMPVAWKHIVVGQSILDGTPFAGMIKDGVDATSVEGAADLPYAVPNVAVDLHSPKVGVPVLWWRSVGHSHTAFVVESFVDELAHAAGRDPVAYRRALLAAHPRHLAVLELAAEKAGWGKPLPKGSARGVAVHESFGSRVAQVAEVTVEGGRVRVTRVVCAVDCGLPVNPDGIRAQMESAIAYGLSAALHGAITLKDGRVEQSNFHDYPVLRLSEMPAVEVHIVPSTDRPTGVGEPGTPPIAPAVANAVFAATGKRLRALPLRVA
jgi:isoquinoline 1-oxidoreductase beta subunit